MKTKLFVENTERLLAVLERLKIGRLSAERGFAWKVNTIVLWHDAAGSSGDNPAITVPADALAGTK